MSWRSKAAPIVRWGGVLIGLLFAVAGVWAVFGTITRIGVSGRQFTQFIVYIYAVIFGILLVIAELQVWPPLVNYFGFLKLGSGRAWFLLFISTLCLSGGLSSNRGAIDHILLTVAGIAGIVLSILGLIIRKDAAVVNRAPVELPGSISGIFNKSERSANGAQRNGPDVQI